ncbi:GNAT family N-acetyltransferase [Williamsia phyllosphaerae]|uniref:N-acetyltransferase n=1 Tax=Williamsia phyllosphaerae TaxID=885042 RepID=A0ABQ1URB8_9NOCA|nr:GNAT family N-acetyltransferase [Williamsia phyllosphaerae]GGF24361.1 N-acetyltransferase [Williamsia phyllosphaerae]
MQIHRLGVDDWERYRDLRIAGLADTPEAFGETIDHARSCTEIQWRQRLSRMQGGHALGVVAVADDGTWTATMRGAITGDDAWLYGVYVVPASRGGGVAQGLLATMSNWATRHADRMLLHVATSNARARRFYERNGFVLTGGSVTNPAHPHLTELEMARSLRK